MGWELRRLARRGLALRVRLVLLYLLFLTFVGFAAYWFYPLPAREVFSSPRRVPVADAAEFARSFALVLLQAQLAAVVAATPALAAAAVSEEKDRHTLPLLLTTDLTDHEIVFGKAAGRTAFVLGAVFAGVPVLALVLPLGGVDVAVLAAGYALTAGTAALCAAVGVSAACRSPDLRSALLRSYGRVAAFVLVFNPFGMLAAADRAGWYLVAAWGYAALEFLAAALILAAAGRALRLREPSAGPPPATQFPAPPRPADPPLIQPTRPTPRTLPPLDAADPVLWKERCAGFRPAWAMPAVARVLSALVVALVIVLFAAGGRELARRLEWALDPDAPTRPPGLYSGGWLLMAGGVFALGRYLLPLAVGVSGAVAGERFRGTLDALLTTPLSRRAILRAKVQAHAERGLGFATAATAGVGMAFTADGVQLGVAAALLVLCGSGLAVALGAWLSVRCPSDTRAFRLLLPFALLVIGWPVGVWNLLRFDPDAPLPPELVARWLFAAAGVCAAAGSGLWWHAGRALERGE
jgi:ABC-type transport system involved in multi-copper enzyme maturation permease subunit